MASSSSNPSSTSSSTTSTPSAASVLSETEWPQLATRAAAPAASATHGAIASATAPNVAPDATASATALGVAPSAIAFASASAPGDSHFIPPLPPTNPIRETTWGGSKGVPPPSNAFRLRRRSDQSRNSAGISQPRNSVGVSQRVFPTPSQESARQRPAGPTSTFAPVMRSTGCSSTSAWSKPLLASAASSSTTLVPNPSGSASTVATSPDTYASTSSAPGMTTIADLALEPDALTSASSSAPGVETIVDAAPEPDTSAANPSSAPGVTTIVDPAPEPDTSASASASAATSASDAAPTIPSLRDNWVALHWGIVPRPVERCPGPQAFGGNGMPPVEAPRPYQLWPPPRLFGVLLCWECRLRPARVEARPCRHLAICVRCYCYANSNRFVCPYCRMPITWLLM